ncbi:asparagine synthetase B family protein [Rubrivivax gelatinosus]|uniref:asparagine synthase (glutamine-hydrolyzing) n=1 Tax=Rubrivivax gelatinosus TaxID=28068 RepID=A0A4R2ML92_RUBGE|nr:asparagine synthase C-terminal domain-containing protein [Rubrivivax gelatinosus]MBK1686091.1 asparagine synthase [Rubrivivax gelatinosus]TCP05584.1 asparagine synthase (glutamine-hydrolysing) [Rubrivivax gelatinosus]
MMTTTTLPLTRRAPDHELAVGEPRFSDPQLAELARRDGPAAAWHRAAATIDSLDAAVRAAAAVDGPFAVGLADARGRVFLAVDRFAVRTLCWRRVGTRLLFAERADALAAAEPAAELSAQSIYDYLYFHAIPSPRTVFEGVFRLPPGHCAWFDGQHIEVRRYWDARFEEPARPDFDALARGFRSRLREAVAGELDGSKPGCFLSGGTDSSTVAGMIKDVAGRAATYSIGFEAEGYDEMAFARIAAKRFGTEHHEYYVTPADLVRSIPEVARHFDQPFGNSSALPAFYCAKMAREDGVTRLLAGDGGDELYGGNARYAKQRIFGWYDAVPGVLRRGLLEPLLEGTPVGALPLARKGRSYVEQAKVPLPDRMQMYNLLLRLGTAEVFTPDFLARVDAGDPLRQQRAVWREAGEASALNRMLAYDWRYTLAESDLPKVCGATSLAGVAVAFPFLERGVVDFSLALPTDCKLKGLKLRWFFKEALRGFLPDEILTKKKQGFGLPFGVWATRHPGLRNFATDTLHSLAGRGIVRREFIETLLAEKLPAHPGYYGEMVWILMMMEQWLQGHEAGRRS